MNVLSRLTATLRIFFDENAKMDPSNVKWFAANLVQMLEQTDNETRTAVLKRDA